MELVIKKCQKPGYENYDDVLLCFEVEGQSYEVLVRPVFWRQMGVLRKIAKEVNS